MGIEQYHRHVLKHQSGWQRIAQ